LRFNVPQCHVEHREIKTSSSSFNVSISSILLSNFLSISGLPEDYLSTALEIGIDGIEYRHGAIEAIYFDDGRIAPDGSGGWDFDYVIRDHLGNTWMVVTDLDYDGFPEVKEYHHYCPFGMLRPLKRVKAGR